MDGNAQMCLLGWTGDNGDPDNFLNVLYGANACSLGTAGNYGFYTSSTAQALLTAALQAYDIEKRATYYKKFQEMIHEDACYVYLAHATQSVAFRVNVQGYVLHPTSRKFFYPVSVE
ncbi:Periplasmic dipeptide transport protein [subsurface metagenome]